MNTNPWRPITTAPKDGTKIWCWLHDKGIMLMHWMSAADNASESGGEPEDYIACWVLSSDPTDDWHPEFWIPIDAIQPPSGVILVKDGHQARWRHEVKAQPDR